MSVPKGKRRSAYSEFEQKMIDLHKMTAERLGTTPARYKKLITEEVYYYTNTAYWAVLHASEIKPKNKDRIEQRNALLDSAVNMLQKLQNPLWTFWNISKYEEKRMAYWAEQINGEILILFKVSGWKGEKKLIQTINWEIVREMVFLDNMSKLQRYTYQKLSHVPRKYYDYVSGEIIQCVNNAWYAVLTGNSIIPKEIEEANEREKLFQYAKEQINLMQRPLYALWNVESFSEREMDEWAGMLDGELRLLTGVIEADAERYCDIKK